MELMEPSDSLSLYKYTSGIGRYTANLPNNPLYLHSLPPAGYTGLEWFTDPFTNANNYLPSRPVRPIGENIIALVLLPRLSPEDEATLVVQPAHPGTALAPNYAYDSTSIGVSGSATNVNDQGMLDSKNQLPPVIQVTMVALDETSYKRFQGSSTSMPTSLTGTLSTLFQNAGDTENPSNPGFAQDLNSLKATLQGLKLNYRIFSTNVSVEGSKWSRAQTN
jgi:uncharacterized protein (TIGR02599 family)